MAAKQLRRTSPKEAEHFYEAWRKSLLFDAPHNFDAFMTYIELDRKPEKRFYAPQTALPETHGTGVPRYS